MRRGAVGAFVVFAACGCKPGLDAAPGAPHVAIRGNTVAVRAPDGFDFGPRRIQFLWSYSDFMTTDSSIGNPFTGPYAGSADELTFELEDAPAGKQQLFVRCVAMAPNSRRFLSEMSEATIVDRYPDPVTLSRRAIGTQVTLTWEPDPDLQYAVVFGGGSVPTWTEAPGGLVTGGTATVDVRSQCTGSNTCWVELEGVKGAFRSAAKLNRSMPLIAAPPVVERTEILSPTELRVSLSAPRLAGGRLEVFAGEDASVTPESGTPLLQGQAGDPRFIHTGFRYVDSENQPVPQWYVAREFAESNGDTAQSPVSVARPFTPDWQGSLRLQQGGPRHVQVRKSVV